MIESFKNKLKIDGFCVLEGFLTEEETENLKSEAVNLIRDMPDQANRTVFSTVDSEKQQNKDKYFLESSDKISYFFEEGALAKDGSLLVEPEVSLNKIGHALHDLNPTFRQITFDERVKEVCFQMGFQEPAIAQSMYIFKNPGIGGEVIPHQDATYLHTEPVNVLGFWIALEDATLQNGCLKFIRGSHKGGVHRRFIKNPDTSSEDLLMYQGPAPFYQRNNFEAVPVPKGSCILIDGQVVHSSDPNRSSKSRHVYTFHVIEQKDTVYSKDNWLQPNPDKPFLSVYKN
ncbi:PREDICTED: phytanoyl-CoA dioxygenase domain-containing protein 1 homolog [Nicrophorus vespilloides]|uniref:Phytanoyl-CoA dioxygenase domain-containing protein 1 homolog n=1 Tax=Nicrophorus vespilloides TaxID=110193 RepID=A0ABM1MNN7_NICVS|nr:PREDICTED: phytanoyl-CoA dioxygenase domain-containing protein 1 homolog [Nicrophorus vespilloides]